MNDHFSIGGSYLEEFDCWTEKRNVHSNGYGWDKKSELIQPGDQIEVTWPDGATTIESLLIDTTSTWTEYDNMFDNNKPRPGHAEIKQRKAYFVFSYTKGHFGEKFEPIYLRRTKLKFKRV